MGSNYYGDHQTTSFGGANEISGGFASVPLRRKGKKSGPDKRKQPQRGLGVAQLEKIRLHNQLGCSYLPSPNNTPYAPPSTFIGQEDMRLQPPLSSSPSSYSSFHRHMMGLQEIDRLNVTHRDSRASHAASARWHQVNVGLRTQQYLVEPNHLGNKNKELIELIGPGNGNSESNTSQFIDLELKL